MVFPGTPAGWNTSRNAIGSRLGLCTCISVLKSEWNLQGAEIATGMIATREGMFDEPGVARPGVSAAGRERPGGIPQGNPGESRASVERGMLPPFARSSSPLPEDAERQEAETQKTRLDHAPAADFGKIQLNQTWQESEIGTAPACLWLWGHRLPGQVGADVRVVAGAVRNNVLAEIVRPGCSIARGQLDLLAGEGIVVSVHPANVVAEILRDLVVDTLPLLPGGLLIGSPLRFPPGGDLADSSDSFLMFRLTI